MSIIHGKKPAGLSPSTVRHVFSVLLDQPWLASREEQLISLFQLCKDQGELELLKQLLYRFTYLTSEKTGIALSSLAERIVEVNAEKKDASQVVATTFDNNPDSAQMILQMLKPRLAERGWGAVPAVTQAGKALRDIEKYPHLILVDEFSGTGKSIIDRVAYLKKQTEAKSKSIGKEIHITLTVMLIACMENAYQHIEEEGINVTSEITLKAGISGYSLGEELIAAMTRMERLESELKQDAGKEEFPSFGYGRAEALYSMENGNIPNSVFPIFWWPVYADGTSSNPIFYRAEASLA